MPSLLTSFVARALLLAVAIGLCTPMHAGIISTFSDRSAWQAATTGRTDIDFSALGLGAGGYTNYSDSAGLTISGVTFTGYDSGNNAYFLYALNPDSGWDENFGTGTLLKGPFWYQSSGITTTYLQVVLPASVTSLGLDLGTIMPRTASLRILVDGVYTGSPLATASNSLNFFGVTADAPISQLRIYVDSGSLTVTQALLDNFSYGTLLTGGGGSGGGSPPMGSETPETSTLLYVGTGVYFLAWRRKRRPVQAV